MSYCGAFPESESHLLIDACLARVRQDAGLDNDPVLPPLAALIPEQLRREPPRLAARLIVGASHLPSAEAIVKQSVKVPSRRTRSTTIATHHTKKKSFFERMRWPVFLCGFLAGTFGGIAVMKSPIGQRPSVQHVIKTARSHAVSAYTTTMR